MKLYSYKEQYKLYHGNMLDMLEVIKSNTIDSIVTDPPYELNFMGKGWDNSGIAFNKEAWLKCYEVLKPGGYLLAFGGTRTYHRIACAIEDAGFEIRDCIMYLYGSGFPKSMNIGKAIEGKLILGSSNVRDIKKLKGKKEKVYYGHNKIEVEQGKRNKLYTQTKTTVDYQTIEGQQWNGWGTGLKPAYEPIIVARKPFKSSVAENIIKNGVGGINIDECRINGEILKPQATGKSSKAFNLTEEQEKQGTGVLEGVLSGGHELGRFPANVIHDGSEEAIKDMPNTSSQKRDSKYNKQTEYTNTYTPTSSDYREDNTYGDEGSASRYFYCAKASKKDRDEGLDMFESKEYLQGCNGATLDNIREKGHYGNGGNGLSEIKIRKNIHPTVKPVELMQYLVRLVTPKNGTTLDCFAGSGSTGKATMFENRERNANYKFIGIELTEEYLPIQEARIDYALNKYDYDFKKELEESKKDGQANIFDLIGS